LDSGWPLCSLCLCGLVLFLIGGIADAWPIDVPNAGFEQIDPHGMPLGWQHVTYWSDSHFHLETSHTHSGHYAIRIDGAPHAQGYLRLRDAIEVSPREILEAGAWVKLANVPTNQCATIAAEFTNTDGRTNDFARFVNIPGDSVASKGWTYVHGTITAPPMAAAMRLRLGFWDGQGTVGFDDMQLSSLTPVACRIDLPWGELMPASGVVPIRIINRIDLAIILNAHLVSPLITAAPLSATIPLGSSTLYIPITVNHRGSASMKMSLVIPGKTLAVDTRDITIPPPVKMSPPTPTHWAVEDGAAHITGDIDLALTEAEEKHAGLVVKLLDKTGQVQALWDSSGPFLVQAPLRSGRIQYVLNTAPLPVGDYTIALDLGTEKKTRLEQTFTVLPRRLESSHVNADGYLVYDGKPIFPLGIFNGDARLNEMSQSGFTLTHAYNACDVIEGRPPNDTAAQNFLDETQRAGLKAIFLVPRDYVFTKDWDAFRRRIRMFKNHPALVAWDEEEGVARGDLSLADLAKMKQILHEEDPNHPLLIGDSRDEIEKIKDRSNFFPLNQMDLGMWWWYPIPPRGHGTALNGDEDTTGLELTPPSFLLHRNTDKPIWVGVQAYDKKGEDPTFKTARYPIPAEYRAQAYIAIIFGAKGLMWYGGSVAGGIYEDPKAGHWGDLKRLVTELHEMIPIFLSPTISPLSFDPASAPISVMRKHTGSGDVILAVNRDIKPVIITFHIPESEQKIDVMNENRSVDLNANKMSDHFGPYAVHVYRLP
jgi:hypothetical protein